MGNGLHVEPVVGYGSETIMREWLLGCVWQVEKVRILLPGKRVEGKILDSCTRRKEGSIKYVVYLYMCVEKQLSFRFTRAKASIFAPRRSREPLFP